MDRTLKATLLSALVFPGAGQLYLRRFGRGLLFLLPTLLAAGYFAYNIYARAQTIADQIVSGSIPLDVGLIVARIEQGGPANPLMDWCAGIMLLCWGLSIADAWLVGRPPAGAPNSTPPVPPRGSP